MLEATLPQRQDGDGGDGEEDEAMGDGEELSTMGDLPNPPPSAE